MYIIEYGREKTAEEVKGFIRQGLNEYFPEIRKAEELPLGNPEGNQIFFRNQEQIFWCRIFFEPVTEGEIQNLTFELEALKKVLRYKIDARVFFPSFKINFPKNKLAAIPFRFFEYRCVKSVAAEEMLFTEYVIPAEQPPASERSVEIKPSPRPYPFLDPARLNRDELSELIQISLDLRKLALERTN